MSPTYSVVIPTVGRPSLQALLRRLAEAPGPAPGPPPPTPGVMPPGLVPPGAVVVPLEIIVVDDTPAGVVPLPAIPGLPPVRMITSGGRGPAAARNAGWQAATTEWVAFLDDDVLPDEDWGHRLAADLAALTPGVAGSQGRVRVPLPAAGPPTDWERTTAGLATARWITADMAYRRSTLAAVGGFDERFGRAYREDADLALRVQDRGQLLVRGERGVRHPVRPADRWVSVRAQAGNADDVLMRRVHGRGWRERAQAPRGRRRSHLLTTGAGLLALALAAGGRWRPARLAAAGWALGTAELAVARIRPGPRDRREVTTMAVTSILIPPTACWHTAAGLIRHRYAGPAAAGS